MNHNAICPECKAGKHVNCTGEALDDYDELVTCICPSEVHVEWRA